MWRNHFFLFFSKEKKGKEKKNKQTNKQTKIGRTVSKWQPKNIYCDINFSAKIGNHFYKKCLFQHIMGFSPLLNDYLPRPVICILLQEIWLITFKPHVFENRQRGLALSSYTGVDKIIKSLVLHQDIFKWTLLKFDSNFTHEFC